MGSVVILVDHSLIPWVLMIVALGIRLQLANQALARDLLK